MCLGIEVRTFGPHPLIGELPSPFKLAPRVAKLNQLMAVLLPHVQQRVGVSLRDAIDSVLWDVLACWGACTHEVASCVVRFELFEEASVMDLRD